MKTINLNRLVHLLFLSITILSCSKGDDTDFGGNPETVSKMSFNQGNYELTPQTDFIIIPLKLEPKAFKDGTITIELTGNATYGYDYTTFPETINGKIQLVLLKDAQAANFIVYRTNDNLSSEKTLSLKLINPTSGFSIGSTMSSEITFTSVNSLPNKIHFNATIGQISEDSMEGLTVELSTTHPVSNGSITKIKIEALEGINYGTHFYTIPAASDNELLLLFNQNATNTSFKVIPINDNVIWEDRDILFEIFETSETLEIGENHEFVVTITDDDFMAGETFTIAQLKSHFNTNQNNWYIPTDYFIEGIITSDLNVLDNKTAYIQDNTAGIMIRFNTPSTLNLGDKIRLNIKNGMGLIINNQKSIVNLNLTNVSKYSENNVVDPEVVTIAQLQTGNYEGKRVKIQNVIFPDADNQRTFLGNHTIKQGNETAQILTYSTAPFSNVVLPQGTISISGIVGDWGRIMPQKYYHDINF